MRDRGPNPVPNQPVLPTAHSSGPRAGKSGYLRGYVYLYSYDQTATKPGGILEPPYLHLGPTRSPESFFVFGSSVVLGRVPDAALATLPAFVAGLDDPSVVLLREAPAERRHVGRGQAGLAIRRPS